MTIANDVFDQLAPTPYAAIRENIRDGDLLLCSAYDVGSRTIRWATRSLWSHIAMAFWLRELDRLLILECVEHIGVRAVPLSDFVTRTSSGTTPYPGKILLARHDAMPNDPRDGAMKRMSGFAFDRLGARFSNAETAKIAARIAMGRLNIRLPGRLAPNDEFICSEYVAKCFEAIDLHIAWDGLGFIAPSDFADDPRVEAVAQIDTRRGAVTGR